MKTNYFKKSNLKNNSQFIEMSKEELKSIQGGWQALLVRDEGGNLKWVVIL
jgi:bacteriocin-like protein